jgi:hypothetical protein
MHHHNEHVGQAQARGAGSSPADAWHKECVQGICLNTVLRQIYNVQTVKAGIDQTLASSTPSAHLRSHLQS